MFLIRPYQPHDFDAMYDICLKTGDAGEDATHLYSDTSILGHIYVGPYVTLEPTSALILADKQNIACGYIIGTTNSNWFYPEMRNRWYPIIRRHVPDPAGDKSTWTLSEKLYHRVHHPRNEEDDAASFLTEYPAHLHIDLLPLSQGQGWGTKLMQAWLELMKQKDVQGVHLGTSQRNVRAIKFYEKLGFVPISDNCHFGIKI